MARVLYTLLAVMVLGYFAWPYASLYGLFADLKASDVEAVRERVQWPAVRAGMKEDLDRFSKDAANRISGKERMDGAKISLSWNALPVTDQIAGAFATPQGLIALFNNPGALRCSLQAIKVGGEETVEACLKKQKESPLPKARTTGIEGPNVSRLFEKFDYAFFTGLFSFRFKVLHQGVPVTLDFKREAKGWVLIRIGLSLETVLAG